MHVWMATPKVAVGSLAYLVHRPNTAAALQKAAWDVLEQWHITFPNEHHFMGCPVAAGCLKAADCQVLLSDTEAIGAT